jgi:hypothetical protein
MLPLFFAESRDTRTIVRVLTVTRARAAHRGAAAAADMARRKPCLRASDEPPLLLACC